MKQSPFGLAVFLCITWIGTGILTPVTGDEAYYYWWSEHLSGFYFDHPPMVAWWIAASPWIRLPFLLMVFSGLLWWKSEKRINMLIVFGLAGFSANLALPDSCALFFTLCWWWGYTTAPQGPAKSLRVLLQVLGMAGMLLSKWNAPVIPILWMLLNRQTSYRNWLAAGIGFLAAVPYYATLFSQEQETLRFHFSGRYADSSFLLQLLAITLAALSLLAFFLLFRRKSSGSALLQASLLYVICLAFPLYKGSFEPNWLWPLLPVLLEIRVLHSSRVPFTGIVGFVLLACTLRWAVALEWIPVRPIRKAAELGKIWPVLAEKANGKPVVFLNQYQHAALYHYHTGNTGFSWNTIQYHLTEYDRHPEIASGDSVYLVLNFVLNPADIACEVISQKADLLSEDPVLIGYPTRYMPAQPGQFTGSWKTNGNQLQAEWERHFPLPEGTQTVLEISDGKEVIGLIYPSESQTTIDILIPEGKGVQYVRMYAGNGCFPGDWQADRLEETN